MAYLSGLVQGERGYRGGYLFVTLEQFVYHHFTKHGDVAYFAYMVSPHGYHTSGVTRFLNLTLYLKLPYRLRIVCVGFMHIKIVL